MLNILFIKNLELKKIERYLEQGIIDKLENFYGLVKNIDLKSQISGNKNEDHDQLKKLYDTIKLLRESDQILQRYIFKFFLLN